MTIRKPSKWALALIAVVALLGAACGGGGGSTATTAPGATTSTSAGGGADLSGQKISVVAVWGGAEQKAFQKVIDQFQENTGASVQYTSAGSADLTTFIGAKIQGGSPPDVAMLPNPGLLSDFASKGDLKPIEDVAGSLVDANFAPAWRELGSYQGQLYGVFFKGANKSTVWFNKHVYDQAGVSAPTDWPGFQQTLQTISDAGFDPLSVDGGSGWPLTDWFEQVYIRTAGPEMYDKLTKHEVPWTDQSVKDALTTLGEVFSHGDWFQGGVAGALAGSFPDNADKLGADPPKLGTYYEGDFLGGIIAADAGAKIGTDIDFYDFPSINGSQPAVVGGGDAAVLFTDNEAAKEFIKYLASPEAPVPWIQLGGFSSPNKNVDPTAYPDPITMRSATALANATVFRFDMSDLTPAAFGGTTGQGMFKGLQDFLKDPSDIEGVTSYLEAQATQAYGA
jgi:ABC-type glycerol-3-phosphate transport system substrate-binding protein